MGPEGQELVSQGMGLRIVTVGIAMVGRPDGRLIICARACYDLKRKFLSVFLVCVCACHVLLPVRTQQNFLVISSKS